MGVIPTLDRSRVLFASKKLVNDLKIEIVGMLILVDVTTEIWEKIL